MIKRLFDGEPDGNGESETVAPRFNACAVEKV